jgi:hypothetical protein
LTNCPHVNKVIDITTQIIGKNTQQQQQSSSSRNWNGYREPAKGPMQLTNCPHVNKAIDLTVKVVGKPLQQTLTGDSKLHYAGAAMVNSTHALSETIASKFDCVISDMDGEKFSGSEAELAVEEEIDPTALRGGWAGAVTNFLPQSIMRPANNAATSMVKSRKSTNYFAKVNLYANSRLPPNLPPLNLYLPSYPLICLAAQFSQRVYAKPAGKEREAFVDPDWRMGTKAMVIKSIPMDDINVVVFAIRGSQTFMDWAVNLKSDPFSPAGFLDDEGNLCHAGFLSVARKMISPVAQRLRHLLEEDPTRSNCSLVMTGHSAGGAVASLLFAHMLSQTTDSELHLLAGCKFSSLSSYMFVF